MLWKIFVKWPEAVGLAVVNGNIKKDGYMDQVVV